MGLKDYREFKKNKMREAFIQSFLSSLNITKQDLKNIPLMKQEIENLKLENEKLSKTLLELKQNNQPVEFTTTDEENIKKYNDKHTSIEDIVKAYEGKSQEFYPHGKPREEKNN